LRLKPRKSELGGQVNVRSEVSNGHIPARHVMILFAFRAADFWILRAKAKRVLHPRPRGRGGGKFSSTQSKSGSNHEDVLFTVFLPWSREFISETAIQPEHASICGVHEIAVPRDTSSGSASFAIPRCIDPAMAPPPVIALVRGEDETMNESSDADLGHSRPGRVKSIYLVPHSGIRRRLEFPESLHKPETGNLSKRCVLKNSNLLAKRADTLCPFCAGARSNMAGTIRQIPPHWFYSGPSRNWASGLLRGYVINVKSLSE
jgi:hypothetical protein